MIDVVQLVKSGRGKFEWGWVLSEHDGHKLAIAVFRDGMKFDNMPAMNWRRNPILGEKTFDGVRLPASANELQQIADYLGCLLLTPKVVDLIWKEAGEAGTQFESEVNIKGKIVAMNNVNDVHEAIEAAVVKAGGDKGGVIASVGKYWVLSNKLIGGKYGKSQAVNYGWPTKGKGNGKGVTGIVNVWQTIGSAHNDQHLDPSQVIRLMCPLARILRRGMDVWEDIDLYYVLSNPALAPLVSHEGVLKALRQPGVPEPEGTVDPNGVIILPEVSIYGMPKPRWETAT